MSDRPVTISGNQGAMIYLAESLAGLKHEQAQTNALLRELIELARLGASGTASGESDDDDVLGQLGRFVQPNGAAPTAPKP